MAADAQADCPSSSLYEGPAQQRALTCGCMCRGYVNTSAVKSAISFIDGDKGILRYRGYPIEQLAERSNFTEVTNPPHVPMHGWGHIKGF